MEMTAKEPRSQVSTALASVERGEAVTITCRGKPAARLVAADEGTAAQGAATMLVHDQHRIGGPRSACGGIGKTSPTWTPICANCAEAAPSLVDPTSWSGCRTAETLRASAKTRSSAAPPNDHPASREWSTRRRANLMHAEMSSASKSGISARTASRDRPASRRSSTSVTRIRRPRTQGRPPHCFGSKVMRFKMSMLGSRWRGLFRSAPALDVHVHEPAPTVSPDSSRRTPQDEYAAAGVSHMYGALPCLLAPIDGRKKAVGLVAGIATK